ncbi:hypothetical protein CASFOL_035277 [Castilleja foliolosa]|uniref:TF-B3 domain-containing protein n=1 Tax=Castilleja foliolosa TaxID=1961234 RepID=A0ABD3BUH5_9LAMI
MADRGARLLRKEKRKAKVGEPSDYTSDDDQSEEYEPGPDSGNNPVVIADEKELAHYNFPLFVPGSLEEKDLLVKIALISQHVDEENPKLDISGTEAYLLTNCLENLDNPPRRFSKDLAMTDMLGNRYRMTVSNHHSEFPSRFLVNTDWSRFVHLHKLKEGDELGFYRLLDPDFGQTCCIVRPFKNPGNLEPSSFSDDNQSMRILPSPEPSVFYETHENDCARVAAARMEEHGKLKWIWHSHMICKDKKEAEVWFSRLKALISRGHQRKWITEPKTDGILSGAASPTAYTRSSPLNPPFGSADGLQKDGANHLHSHCPTKSSLDKTFLNVTFSSDPASPSVHLVSSGGSDGIHGHMKRKREDAFTVNPSRAVGSTTSKDSGQDDAEKNSTGNQLRPCFLINHPIRQTSEIYFPFSDQCLVVDVRIAGYSIIGQSTPGLQRDNWFIMCHRGEGRTIFYNGRTIHRLPNLPCIPMDSKILACYWGNPGRDCRVLLLAFTGNVVTCLPYSSGVWAYGRGLVWSDYHITFETAASQKPEGHITTQDGFSWVDAKSGRLYVYRGLWSQFDNHELLRTPTVAEIIVTMGVNIFRDSDRICSLIQV